MNIINSLLVKAMQASVLVVLMFVGATTKIPAQELDAKNIYPDAPVPEILHVHAVMNATVQTPRTLKHRWLNLNNLSIATLVAGEVIDSLGTYKNLTHPKWICGNSPALAGGYDTNAPKEISSLRDVQTVCGVGLAGQSANWAFDGTRVGYFSEGGWVTQLHLAGNRNYAGVEGWNLANDLGWYLIAHRFGRKTGWIGKCGPAINFGRGFAHLDLGIGNFIAVSHHKNPNTLNLYVPKDSNYAAPRWWGR